MKAGTTSVIRLLESAADMHRQYEKKVSADAMGDATKFNPVTFFGDRETILSRVIAWMLDLRATHGQGVKFLTLFLRQFAPERIVAAVDDNRISRTGVHLEAATTRVRDQERRRIDILVKSPDFTIAIENKPYAFWQDGQLVSYWNHISHHNSILLTFLGYGEDAQAEVERHWREDCRGRLSCAFPGTDFVRGFNYEDLGKWVSECADVCDAASVTGFLKQFSTFCMRVGAGGMDSDESDELIDHLISSPDQIDAALRIEAVMDTVRQKLAVLVSQELQTQLEGWQITSEGVYSEKRYGVSASKPSTRGSIDFFLFGPKEYIPWVGIERQSSRKLAGDEPGKKSGNWKWWRALTEEDLGVPPLEAWRLPPRALVSQLATIARGCCLED